MNENRQRLSDELNELKNKVSQYINYIVIDYGRIGVPAPEPDPDIIKSFENIIERATEMEEEILSLQENNEPSYDDYEFSENLEYTDKEIEAYHLDEIKRAVLNQDFNEIVYDIVYSYQNKSITTETLMNLLHEVSLNENCSIELIEAIDETRSNADYDINKRSSLNDYLWENSQWFVEDVVYDKIAYMDFDLKANTDKILSSLSSSQFSAVSELKHIEINKETNEITYGFNDEDYKGKIKCVYPGELDKIMNELLECVPHLSVIENVKEIENEYDDGNFTLDDNRAEDMEENEYDDGSFAPDQKEERDMVYDDLSDSIWFALSSEKIDQLAYEVLKADMLDKVEKDVLFSKISDHSKCNAELKQAVNEIINNNDQGPLNNYLLEHVPEFSDKITKINIDDIKAALNKVAANQNSIEAGARTIQEAAKDNYERNS